MPTSQSLVMEICMCSIGEKDFIYYQTQTCLFAFGNK